MITPRDVIDFLHDVRTKGCCELWRELENARLVWLLQPDCTIPGCLICGDLDVDTQTCRCDLEGWEQ